MNEVLVDMGEGDKREMTASQIAEVVAEALSLAWEYALPAPPDFDEVAYLAACPDVAAAMEVGNVKSAFVHYVLMGRKEGRFRPVRSRLSDEGHAAVPPK